MTSYDELISHFPILPNFPHLVVFEGFGEHAIYFDNGVGYWSIDMPEPIAKQAFILYLKATSKWFMYRFIPSVRPILAVIVSKDMDRWWGAIALAEDKDMEQLRKLISGKGRI